MAYGFAQRVVANDPDEVFNQARTAARDAGFGIGPVRRTRGVLRERYLPIDDGRVGGRLWVWALAPGLSVAYLGLRDFGALAWLAHPHARKKLGREAAALLEAVGDEPDLKRYPYLRAAAA
ncbi:MAG: hypothetical protein LC722_03620, partial [Actinobacteria bacterium]|nr:hypothetical protein [Actinomycetota bacterium]